LIRAILNPRAGTAARRAYAALEHGTPAWREIEICLTERRGHAGELARAAAERGDRVVIVAGGDGTANEAGHALLGSQSSMALVPVGSGNGLARSLGIPLEPGRALRALSTGALRAMDVGLLNDRPFLNVAGAGFDAAVGAEFHERGARGGRRGIFTYVQVALQMLGSHPPQAFLLESSAGRFDGAAWIVGIGNGRQYGGGAFVAPRASLDDGLLDLFVIEASSSLELLLNAPRSFVRRLDGFRRYRHFQATEAVLSSPLPFPSHRDGEPDGSTRSLIVGVRPRALRVWVPQATLTHPLSPFGAPAAP
jgi:diacylglycerol kinase (ATP)